MPDGESGKDLMKKRGSSWSVSSVMTAYFGPGDSADGLGGVGGRKTSFHLPAARIDTVA